MKEKVFLYKFDYQLEVASFELAIHGLQLKLKMMALIVALNGLLDELDCMKRIINIKTTLLNFPGKIISTKETEDIQSYFKEFERKIESYFRTFLSEKEKDAKSKKPKTLEAKERFKEIENLFDKVKKKKKAILSKADFLINEFNLFDS